MKRKLIQILILGMLVVGFASTAKAADFDYTNDPEALATMDRLIERLTVSSNPDTHFQAVILSLEQVNAFSVSDGRIIVTEGLLRTISTEEQLAAAIAHEMGHRINAVKATETRAFAATDDEEFTADTFAIQVLTQAGFNPNCLAEMLRVVLHSDGSSFPKAQIKQLSSRIRKIEDKVGSQVSSVKTAANQGD
ncbi:MAG: M48 family metallopeptidase [Acidobacteriia bacterium]|nr:M48 family metallopeptidase [Terriglobia bacterium]